MLVSNSLAAGGARVARGLVILILDHTKLREWYAKVPNTYYNLKENLNILETNRDTAVIYVRLMGTERLADALDTREEIFSVDTIKKRASLLLLAEMQQRSPRGFEKYYELNDLDRFTVRFDNQIFADRIDIDKFLSFFQAYFDGWNLGVKDRISQNIFHGDLRIAHNSQNRDFAGFWYDFETSLPGSQYQSSDYTRSVYASLDTNPSWVKEIAFLGYKNGLRGKLR